MPSIKKAITAILIIVSITGCASKMPIRPDGPLELKSNESLAVFKMTLKNDFKNYLLTPEEMTVKATKASGGKTYYYTFSAPERQISGREVEMMGSFALPPGDYTITGFAGRTDMGFAILPVVGKFDPSFVRSFSVGENDSVYLGHIIARLIEKKSHGEERAGPIIPLLDQATTGMSNGTFKFEVVDDYQKDTEYLKVRYPSVGNRSFRRALLNSVDAGPSEVSVIPVSLEQSNEPSPQKPIAAPVSSQSNPDNCTVSQILEMKKLGLSDGQIKRSCGGAK